MESYFLDLYYACHELRSHDAGPAAHGPSDRSASAPDGVEITAFEEARRHPELAAIAEDPAFVGFLDEVVRLGVATGEIEPAGTETAKQVLFAFTLGFAGMANHLDLAGARDLAEGCKRLIAGQLLAVVPAPVG